MQGILMLIILLFSLNPHEAVPLQSSFSPVIVMAEYNKEYKHAINSDVVFMFLYNVTNISLMETLRINIESNASNDEPLIVFVHGNKEILSWQIPLVVKSRHFDDLLYNKTSRTLCPTKYKQKRLINEEKLVTVSLSTANIQNISFKLNMTLENHFHLSLGENRSIEISPSQPVYYGYTFSKEIESFVIVHVKSDSDICMILSIQNISCPAFDLDDTIEFSGYWQTVNRQGGILVPREKYPLGFFIVLTVKSDDTDCYGVPVINSLRVKHVILTINASITKRDYILASGVVVLVIFSFCAIYVVSIVVSKIKEGREVKQLLYETSEHIVVPIPSSSTVEEIASHQFTSVDEDSSLDEDDIDVMEDAFSDKEVIRTKRVLSVCDLARKDPKILRHKSRLYFYYLITITIFYTLPAIQLVFTYQYILDITGNGDSCYYNFLCAHPLGAVSDVNHVFSNIGYILLGLLFIFLTYCREHKFEKEKNYCYGIPQHYGLFYAMGTALVMEGILSGCYHICPNRSNFQFDTSFMYIITVLCMIKIYQTRHPDINARASVTFGILAFIIFVGLIGEENSSIYFWITFTIMYLLTCLYMTIQIYYMGRCKCNQVVKVIQSYKHDARSGIKHLFQPLYPGRFLMLVVANLCNVVLAVLANMFHIHNFPTFLLIILLSNLVLYTIFYILMKIFHKERILLRSLIYIVLSFVFWSAALYFFINKTISWEHTPAQSRTYNKPCILLDFFDNHDIWHFLSALALFFSFMVLLTLDDDLIDVHRSQIPVF